MFAFIFNVPISFKFVIASPGCTREPSLKFFSPINPSNGATIFKSLILAVISFIFAASFFFFHQSIFQ